MRSRPHHQTYAHDFMGDDLYRDPVFWPEKNLLLFSGNDGLSGAEPWALSIGPMQRTVIADVWNAPLVLGDAQNTGGFHHLGRVDTGECGADLHLVPVFTVAQSAKTGLAGTGREECHSLRTSLELRWGWNCPGAGIAGGGYRLPSPHKTPTAVKNSLPNLWQKSGN